MLVQKLLKLLWTVYSEETLQSCLKLRNFQNPFNKTKTVGLKAIPCTKSLKGLKFAPIIDLSSEFKIYLYHSSKIAKAGSGFELPYNS